MCTTGEGKEVKVVQKGIDMILGSYGIAAAMEDLCQQPR